MKTDDLKKQQWKAWQQRLDLALKNLPEKTAPTHLLPNVMAKIRTTEAEKAFNRPYLSRLSRLRMSAAILALSMMAYLSFVGERIYENDIIPAFELAGRVCRTVLGSLADIPAAFAIGDETLRFLVPVLICLMLTMYLTCIGVGTFIYRTVRR